MLKSLDYYISKCGYNNYYFLVGLMGLDQAVLVFTLTVPLSTQEYKRVPASCQVNLTKCWWVTWDELASHPGGVAILLVASWYGDRDKLRK